MSLKRGSEALQYEMRQKHTKKLPSRFTISRMIYATQSTTKLSLSKLFSLIGISSMESVCDSLKLIAKVFLNHIRDVGRVHGALKKFEIDVADILHLSLVATTAEVCLDTIHDKIIGCEVQAIDRDDEDNGVLVRYLDLECRCLGDCWCWRGHWCGVHVVVWSVVLFSRRWNMKILRRRGVVLCVVCCLEWW